MNNKFFLVLFFLCAGMSSLTAVELSGTYNKDFTVKTEFNTVSAGKTLRVTNNSTFIMTDAIVTGNIIVEKGSSLIGPKDGEGYLVFGKGTHVEGIDLYYKIRVAENLMFTRKIPMTLDEIWKSGNKELIEMVSVIEFCYSTALKGWVSIGEWRYLNPFNENLYEGYYMKSEEAAPERELPGPAISGTYDKNYTLETGNNTIVQGTTLKVTKGATYTILKEIYVKGNLIVDKGASFIAGEDNAGNMRISKGAHVEGIDLYYKIHSHNGQVFTRKIPMTLDEIWNSGNKELIDFIEIMEFCYSSDLKGWVTTKDMGGVNPFNENLYDDFDIVITKSASQVIEFECRSLIIKNKSTLTLQPCKDYWGTKINESITVESGSSLVGTADGHKLILKRGIKIQGLPLYVIYDNNYIPVDTILSDIWEQHGFNDKEYIPIYYSPDLKGWVFEERLYPNDVSSDFKKKTEKLKKKK